MNDVLETSGTVVDEASCGQESGDDWRGERLSVRGKVGFESYVRRGSRMYERAGISSAVDMMV